MPALSLTFRLLQATDGAAYQALRLTALERAGAAYLTTLQTESAKHEQAFAAELDSAYHPPWFGYYGAFVEDQLVGYCHVSQMLSDKQRHCAEILNLYIDEGVRGQGVATALLTHLLGEVAAHEHIERVFLSCLASNQPAQALYGKLGFRKYGVKEKSVKWQGQYDDEVLWVREVK
jgi:RimJ/RimL family protein N-acetyltransferase